MKNPLIKDCYALSDIGVKRKQNEDVFASLEELGFFALADGMGGHRAGDVAAKEAINYLCSSVKEVLGYIEPSIEIDQLSLKLKRLFENANDWIYRLSQTSEALLGMGTTLCSILFLEENIVFSHIGDSRIYCLRGETLNLITEDHAATIRIKSKSPHLKKILTQVIGSSKEVHPQVGCFEKKPHDLYLICSDGLSDFVPKEYIRLILQSPKDLKTKASLLIETAKNQGSTDNITVLLIQT